MRIGIFGGSFDPIHFGHLILAETCREQARLDEVWFMPAAEPPHKRNALLSPAKDRIEMLRLAIGGHSGLQISTIETDRGGVSYTVETLRVLHDQQPHDELFLLMGGDTLVDFPKWREPSEILILATPVVVQRHGSPTPNFDVLSSIATGDQRARFAEYIVEMPVIELSSTELRERVRGSRSIRYRTPRAVEKYIEAQKLYLE